MTRIPTVAPMPIPALVPDVKAELEGFVEGDDGEGELARVLVWMVADADDALGEVGDDVGEVDPVSVFVNGVL